MKLRPIIIAASLLMPGLALADDTGMQAQAPQSAVGASDLVAQPGGASSTGASNYLQPNASSLQGSTADGGNLSAPTDQTLQAAPADDSLKIMLGGEADGAPHTLSDTSRNLGGQIVDIATGILIVCAAIGMLRRRVIATNPVY